MMILIRMRHILVILLTILVIVLSGFFVIKHGKATTGDNWDLGNFITSVEFMDSSNQIINNRKFTLGEVVHVRITFQEGANQFSYFRNETNESDPNNGFLLYQLPIGVLIVEGPNSTYDIKAGLSDTIVGSYTLNQTGLVKIQYNNAKRADDTSTEDINYIDRYNNVGLVLAFDIVFSEATDGESIFDFGINQDITIVIIEDGYGDPNTDGNDESEYDGEQKARLSLKPNLWDRTIKKTIDGTPINVFFGDKYEEISKFLTFNVYKSPDGESKGELIKAQLMLDSKGDLVLPERCIEKGWYLIEEMVASGLKESLNSYLSSIGYLTEYELADPIIYVYVSSHGIGSVIKKNFTEGKYSINSNQGAAGGPYARQYVDLVFPCGCHWNRNKPNARFTGTPFEQSLAGHEFEPQNLTTEIFTTTLSSDGNTYFSLCADMGAHQVLGGYEFDYLNHNFTDDELYYLIAAFDKINNSYDIGLTTNSSNTSYEAYFARIAAQLVLWNTIFQANNSAGFADFWIHDSNCSWIPKDEETGTPLVSDVTWYELVHTYGKSGTAQVLGTGVYNKTDPNVIDQITLDALNDLVLYIINNPQEVVDEYHNKDRNLEDTFVTGVVYIKGDHSYTEIEQQRQLIVQFGKCLAFDNKLKQTSSSNDGSLTIHGKKIVEHNLENPQGFTFVLERVWGTPYHTGYKYEDIERYFSPEIKYNDRFPDQRYIEAVSDENGNFSFGTFTFPSYNSAGFHFRIFEKIPVGVDEWIYDNTNYWIYIQDLVPNNGQFDPYIESIYKGPADGSNGVEVNSINGIVFTNKLRTTPARIEIPIQKIIVGSNVPIQESSTPFIVNVYKVSAVGLKPIDEEFIESGCFSVSSAYTFTRNLSPGEYIYCFQEVIGSILEYTYDTSDYWVKITVTEYDDATCIAKITEIMKANNAPTYSELLGSDGQSLTPNVVFTNLYTHYSNVFPSVGGTGTYRLYLLSIVALIGLLIGYKMWMYNIRRKSH